MTVEAAVTAITSNRCSSLNPALSMAEITASFARPLCLDEVSCVGGQRRKARVSRQFRIAYKLNIRWLNALLPRKVSMKCNWPLRTIRDSIGKKERLNLFSLKLPPCTLANRSVRLEMSTGEVASRRTRQHCERCSNRRCRRVYAVSATGISRSPAGHPSFQRSTRKMSLTEAGETFRSRLGPIIDDCDAARAAATAGVEEPSGLLRVTASHAFGEAVLAPLLTGLCEEYLLIDIDLVLTDDIVDVVSRQMDLGFRNGPPPSGDLIVSKLLSTERRLVASPNYLRRHDRPRRPQDLEDHVCLTTSNAPQQQTWYFRRAFEKVEVGVCAKVRTASTISFQRCVRDGLGLSLLVDWLVDDDIRRGSLVRVIEDWTVTVGQGNTAFWIVYPSRARICPSRRESSSIFVRAKVSGEALSQPPDF